MTSEKIRELRAAAKRLYGCSQAQVARDIRDVDILVDAVLDLFPADDAEPVTEDWLREKWGWHQVDEVSYVAFYRDSCRLESTGRSTSWRLYLLDYKVDTLITTRRQFRQLAAALTIEPKKGGV